MIFRNCASRCEFECEASPFECASASAKRHWRFPTSSTSTIPGSESSVSCHYLLYDLDRRSN